MTKQRPLLLAILVIYIFSPTLFSWVSNPNGAWYKPFVIWAGVIVVAYFIQKSHSLASSSNTIKSTHDMLAEDKPQKSQHL